MVLPINFGTITTVTTPAANMRRVFILLYLLPSYRRPFGNLRRQHTAMQAVSAEIQFISTQHCAPPISAVRGMAGLGAGVGCTVGSGAVVAGLLGSGVSVGAALGVGAGVDSASETLVITALSFCVAVKLPV